VARRIIVKIEISEIFIDDNKLKKNIEIELKEPKKVVDILEELGVKNLGYADFYLNDKKVKKDTIAKNDDLLTVLPIIGGG
jgi:sulfur carrier protein ThiS